MDYTRLLDFSKPLDIGLFDRAVIAFNSGQTALQEILVKFQNHPQAWTRVDAIVEKAQQTTSKIMAATILEKTVQFRWNVLPPNQRVGIKKYIVDKVIKMASNRELVRQQSTLLGKLNMVLVQIVKHEWPAKWPRFIVDLVASSKKSESLCANNMTILRLLSEEVFDFSQGQLTSEKMKVMKKHLNDDFGHIFKLCQYILQHSRDVTLLTITLRTLLRFLIWIPVGYIFETNFLAVLTTKFFPAKQFQNDTLQCLSEVAALKLPDKPAYNPKFIELFCSITRQVYQIIKPDTNIALIYLKGPPGPNRHAERERVQTLVRHLSLFYAGFLKAHLSIMENADGETKKCLFMGFQILLRLSTVKDVEIFKICLEYWNILVLDLYLTQKTLQPQALLLGSLHQQPQSSRVLGYSGILSSLRVVIIQSMAKPEEVLIVTDEHGDAIREPVKDTDGIILYKNMRECLICLTHLDSKNTQEVIIRTLDDHKEMVERFKRASQGMGDFGRRGPGGGPEFDFEPLNKLCWAIGSISGALSDTQEKNFLVTVIKHLLNLCEDAKGKNQKAIIASNIMYVVGQYPRFLKQHWKFLKTVVNKLFEFMHEKHPGVQDMSCDTFIKIAKKCKKKFVTRQSGENPFVEEIISKLSDVIRDLEQSQIHTFYEAVAHIIQAESNPAKRQHLLKGLMYLPNKSWSMIVSNAKNDTNSLWSSQTVKVIVQVLKTNNRVCSALGPGYIVQLSLIFVEMLQVYKSFSEFVSTKIQKEGPEVVNSSQVKAMMAVKKEALKLIQSFIKHSAKSDTQAITQNYLPRLLQPVTTDYRTSHVAARDEQVLSLCADVLTELKGAASNYISVIFENTFTCTLAMINKNFQDFPGHRLQFFNLLRAVNNTAFASLVRLPPAAFQSVIDAIVWAFKHMERTVAETGLNILLELIRNVESSAQHANQFYQRYYISLLKDLLGVLTDTFHKSCFKLHANLLANLFKIVDTGKISVPLFDRSKVQFPNNQQYIRQYVGELLHKSFPNLNKSQIEGFIIGSFRLSSKENEFKSHLRDFLVQLKGFEGGDNKDLFLEEQKRKIAAAAKLEQARVASVPGMLYQGPSAQMLAEQQSRAMAARRSSPGGM